jgi:hypothetical protein
LRGSDPRHQRQVAQACETLDLIHVLPEHYIGSLAGPSPIFAQSMNLSHSSLLPTTVGTRHRRMHDHLSGSEHDTELILGRERHVGQSLIGCGLF